MPITIRSLVIAGALPVSLLLGCSIARPPAAADQVRKLIELSKESNAALLRGDGDRYGALVKHTEDFTLMSPFGGKPTHGAPSPARLREIGRFFKGGTLDQEVVEAYASPDMIVLATIERAHVEVVGVPAQNWGLRVTLVYRREGSEWRLAHRHADPLADPISVPASAVLARGERQALP
jgi:ketosteroid isomerase-like protein